MATTSRAGGGDGMDELIDVALLVGGLMLAAAALTWAGTHLDQVWAWLVAAPGAVADAWAARTT